MAFRGWMAARGWLISLIALAMPAAFADAVELKLGLDAQPLANPAGGRSHSGTWMQQLNLTVTAGSGLHRLPENWREQDHWRTRLQLSLFSGADDLNERIGAAFPLQSVAYPSGLWLTEASLERQSGAGAIGLKAGVFALNPDFVEARC
jgi:porin